jgi:hypothetical protein
MMMNTVIAACLAAVLRQLSREGSAEFVSYQNSTLMQLLSGAACPSSTASTQYGWLLIYLHGLGIIQAPRHQTARSQHGSWAKASLKSFQHRVDSIGYITLQYFDSSMTPQQSAAHALLWNEHIGQVPSLC